MKSDRVNSPPHVSRHCRPGLRQAAGFSLLEMLTVIALIAAVAFIATATMTGLRAKADDQIVVAEMQQVAKALKQFRQDTGYWPGEGPFALAPAGCAVTGAGINPAALPSCAGTTHAERKRWLESPANFYQLMERPDICSGHALEGLETWDAARAVGWRGPYIKGFESGYVDLRDNINPGAAGAGGDPLAGSNVPDVPGIADPFEHAPETVAGGTLLDWSARPRPNRIERSRWGRPYLFFSNSATAAGSSLCPENGPALVSMGPDGEYDQGADDDLVLCL